MASVMGSHQSEATAQINDYNSGDRRWRNLYQKLAPQQNAALFGASFFYKFLERLSPLLSILLARGIQLNAERTNDKIK